MGEEGIILMQGEGTARLWWFGVQCGMVEFYIGADQIGDTAHNAGITGHTVPLV